MIYHVRNKDIWDIFFNNSWLSSWSTKFCIDVRDDPYVRKNIITCSNAMEYCYFKGDKDERISRIRSIGELIDNI